jgi:hypothetical protein
MSYPQVLKREALMKLSASITLPGRGGWMVLLERWRLVSISGNAIKWPFGSSAVTRSNMSLLAVLRLLIYFLSSIFQWLPCPDCAGERQSHTLLHLQFSRVPNKLHHGIWSCLGLKKKVHHLSVITKHTWALHVNVPFYTNYSCHWI